MALGRKQTSKTRTPLAAHPAFAVILGLWVAALFGLGVMVLPASLLEGIVARFGIAEVLPAAAPPLGTTARLMVAAAAACGGAVIGIAAGRLLASLSNKTPPVAAVEIDEPIFDEMPVEPLEEDLEPEPFPFDVDPDLFEEEEAEPMASSHSVEHREPTILTIEELDSAGLDRAVAKDEAHDWEFEEANHDPEDFRPDVGGWGPEEDFEEPPVPAHDDVPNPPVGASDGLGALRSRKLEELSLVQLVERFGGALAEHREAIERNPELHSEVQPVIAAALKALTVHERGKRPLRGHGAMVQGNAALDISTRQQAEATEEALRDALEKLQKMSGNF